MASRAGFSSEGAPWPVEQDEEARERYLAQLAVLLRDEEVDIWYLDEMGLRAIRAPGGAGRLQAHPALRRHASAHERGWCHLPENGGLLALEFSRSNSVALQALLDEANNDLRLRRPRNIIICDKASWHRNKSIDWGRFEVLFLPPFSPDLNPIERLWLLIKAEWFSYFYARDMSELTACLDRALTWAIDRAEGNQKTCAIR